MRNIEVGEYKRIHKNAVKNHLLAGETVYMLPCNISPVNVWGYGTALHLNNIQDELYTCYNETLEKDFDKAFTRICNAYKAYLHNEEGKYIAFYIKPFDAFHLEFSDGSNPYFHITSDEKTIANDLKKWRKRFTLHQYKTVGNVAYFTATERKV